MSCYSGPEITNDGLVLYYDMNNTQKSWKGAPTVNLITNPRNLSSDRSAPASCGSSFTDFTTGGPTDGQFVRVTRVTTSPAADWPWQISYPSIAIGTTFKFSCYARSINGTVSTIKFSNPDLEEVSFTLTPQWQRFSTTFTSGVQSNLQFMRINRSNANDKTIGSIYDVADAQIEVQSIVTPFVDGSRTNTQALLDLTNNNTLTASSLTYASDNTFSFNGTSNYISCGNLGSFYPNGTISMWINSAVMANYNNPFSTQTGNVGIRFEETALGGFYVVVGNDSATFTAHTYFASGMLTNTWYNIVLVWNVSGNNVVGYLNGTQVFNEAQTYWATTLPTVTIGAWAGIIRYWNGSISNVGIYNTALTSDQVKQNFNATRGRYGI